jgi:hypothetical protein
MATVSEPVGGPHFETVIVDTGCERVPDPSGGWCARGLKYDCFRDVTLRLVVRAQLAGPHCIDWLGRQRVFSLDASGKVG